MKKNPSLLLQFFIGIIIIVFIFRQWMLSSEIIGGDWPFFFNETLKQFTLFPPAWSLVHGNGLGGTILTYYIDQYLYFTAYLSTGILHIPWAVGYKLFWFGLFIVLSIFSSIYLLRTIFSGSHFWQMGLAAFIFTANTYILMVVGGGQMGVALAYSIAPLVFARFLMIFQNSKFTRFAKAPARREVQKSLLAGLVLAAQVMFDPRIAYLSMIAVMAYYLINKFQISPIRQTQGKFQIVSMLYTFVIPIGIAVLLHSYWIFPLLVTRTLQVPEGFISVSGFAFFSFADFSHSLSMLHPNWPENIFGKVYFLKPEFLIFPIIAFSALLFTKNRTILFFSSLALLGSFLAKGANPPFGQINEWLFQHFPGMNMFRDPTKWYTLVAISYSILIPFSIGAIYNLIKSQPKFQISNFKFQIKSKSKIFNFQNLFLVLICFYLIPLIMPALLGQLGGTFKQNKIPKEYTGLKDFLRNQPDFFRTLWIPRQQRFTFVSSTHPAIEAMPLFEATNSAHTISRLQELESQRFLEKLSVKYVIIPYDSIGEIFLRDRKYDKKQRINLEKQLDNIVWLKKINTGKITIYETQLHRDHFWLEGGGKVAYEMLSPTTYNLDIEISQPTKLVFSENFSSYWAANEGNSNILSKNYKGINSFDLNKTGRNRVRVFFSQEKEYIFGRYISLGMAMLLVGIFFSRRDGR